MSLCRCVRFVVFEAEGWVTTVPELERAYQRRQSADHVLQVALHETKLVEVTALPLDGFGGTDDSAEQNVGLCNGRWR